MARRYDNKGESYINCYPGLKKWINECAACHRKGYSLSIPDRINDTAKIEYIKKYFQPLALDANGLCEQCAKANH